ncbi:MAG: hypothetical protein KGZ52_06905 [Xanthomonadaceae bacterium]|jgi:hypothetical protein|nr:hypothetical protein [Xanthomonadaceae bacterium]
MASVMSLVLVGWTGLLALLWPAALLDGLGGGVVMVGAILLSGAYALGGGAQAGEGAAFRNLAATLGRWLLAGTGLLLLAAREGAVVWAVAGGAVLGQLAYIAAAVTFKRA